MSAFVRVVPRIRSLVYAKLQLRAYASYPPHTIIGMPALSPTMSQGNLAVWTKKVGEKLNPGEVIAEIETDKAQMDFEFQEEGYLAKVLVPEGTKDVPVNKPIAVYVEEESDVASFKDFTLEESSSPSNTKNNHKETEGLKKEPESKKPVLSNKINNIESPSSNRIIASPLAKTIALEHGISLKKVTGTGTNGRITKSDIDEYLKKSASEPAPVSSQSDKLSYKDIPISNMRQIIGNRLLQSTQNIPSYIISSDISVSKLLKLRTSLNANAKEQFKLSINDILIKAISIAAKKCPEANSYWMQEQGVIRQFDNVDISVAVATPTGLITPIVRNADSKGLVSISNEIKDLGKRAKENKLKPEEFQGGTICISNLGMNGAVSMFTSIINPPQSTILAVATVKKVAVEDASTEYGFSFDDVMTITGTFDHRTIDGAKAGDFMKELKKVIENPLELML